ncbi:hypothetical protein H4R20_006315, partial [Coemansia guatemalensis]
LMTSGGESESVRNAPPPGIANEGDYGGQPGSSRQQQQHRRHHHHHRHHGHQSRRSGRGSSQLLTARSSAGHDGDQSRQRGCPSDCSGDESFSESGSTTCSTASSYSVDYPEPQGHGRRHRHHRHSYGPVDSSSGRRGPSRRMSSQNIAASRRSTVGRRVQMVVEQPEDSDSSDGARDEESGRRRSETGESSGSSEDQIVEADEEGSNVRARQEALNTRHPFGLPIWKPALYKKSRSVTRAAFLALHAQPLRSAKLFLKPGNIAWLVLAGWWLMVVCMGIAVVLFVVPFGGHHYARVAGGLGWYLLWPFGRYVERIKDNAHGLDRCALTPAEEATDGASALEAGRGLAASVEDEEVAPLLSGLASPTATPLQERGAGRRHAQFQRQTVVGRAVYYVLLVAVLNPMLIFVSALSWFAVFSIPMGKLTHTLARYLWRDPLSLHFRSGDLPTVKVP